MGSDGSYFELHPVSGQSTCLVREDMLYLPKFFVEGSTPNRRSFFPELAVHELVLIDEIALSHFDYFHRYDQRNRDHCVD